MFGSQLFRIYINDMDVGIKYNISKFANHGKLGGNLNCEEDAQMFQGDVERLREWPKVCQLDYNVEKCEVI